MRVPVALRDLWKIRDSLVVDDCLVLHGAQLVIPAAMTRLVLSRLYDFHRGIEAIERRARQTVWWPGITSDIVSTMQSCDACKALQPSQQKGAFDV